MRNTWTTRFLRAFLALWFVLAGGEHGVVHGCPMHDGVGGSAHSHAMAMQGGHAAMHDSFGSSTNASHHSGSPSSAHPCTCVGSCSAAAAVVAPMDPPTLQVAFVRRPTATVSSDLRTTRIPLGAHVLPFGNGPPAPALIA